MQQTTAEEGKTRDEFGSPDEVATYALSSSITIEWIEGANHGLSTRAALAAVAQAASGFIDTV